MNIANDRAGTTSANRRSAARQRLTTQLTALADELDPEVGRVDDAGSGDGFRRGNIGCFRFHDL
ncbi:hypothetical protein AB0B85_06130 [Micromonospora sp. NPDC049044]|uniref:hypothetical protein n=1 Tax=unclassified Micromonospora TaxID=2617518 RepID=UPI003408082E